MCDCEKALALLSARLDGALDQGERAELDEHLAQCEECRAAADALAGIHAVMPELVEEVPEGFHRRVMEKIAAEKVVAFPVKKRSGSWKSWASMAAVFAVILLGAGGLNQLAQTKSGGAAPMSVAPAGAEYSLGDTAAGTGAPRSTPLPGVVGYEGGEAAPADVGVEVQSEPVAAEKNEMPAAGDAVAPTPAQDEPQEPAGTPPPQMQVRTVMTVTPEQAVALVAEMIYPGMKPDEVRDAEGSYVGVRVTLADESVDVTYLGLTPNGAYHECYVLDAQGQESYYAVGLDGSSVESLTELGREAYDALVGHTS